MKIVMFYHTLLSDWNHGNAHFLRGIVTELLARRHEVQVFEPRDSWSARHLVAEHGPAPIRQFHAAYPGLKSTRYDLRRLDLEEALDRAGLVLVHEWNEPDLVERIGRHHGRVGGYRLFFHDTHHRMATDPGSMARYNLDGYDGVLAYGRVLQELYLKSGRARRVWTWHEGADTRVFHPLVLERRTPFRRDGVAGRARAETDFGAPAPAGDLVWIGNWGDDERTAELNEFLIQPSRALGLKTRVHGVRYPETARRALAEAGIEYAGWLPNFDVPGVFAQHKVTVHIPRRPYVQALPGIPTIRPFEALACGIPLVCSPWHDAEGLFTPGRDFLVANNGRQMKQHLKDLLHDESLRRGLAAHGLRTIQARHTCAHRVEELLAIAAAAGHEAKRPAATGGMNS